MAASGALLSLKTKIRRASQHMQELQLAVNAFLQSKPYGIGTKDDPASGRHIYFVATVRNRPPELATITGDLLQNLRGALDHLAYELVSVGVGGPPQNPAPIAYPITDTEAGYRPFARAK